MPTLCSTPPVRMFAKPEDLIIIVTGGPGKHSQYMPTFGSTRADGTLVKSVHEFKRH